ncbi:MAG: hypothetical protein WC784_04790 [Candidatus Shapirobacteria bacterium]|jgi:exopolyphosphatase/guanosine-5'-triphosphate,3'-diphosphate pyrophosphatase
MKVGVIDIGTLKVKMLLGEWRGEEFKEIYQSNALSCLGVRMNENNNRPFEENIKKLIEILKECKRVIKENKVKKVRVVSTHALREMGEEGQKIANRIKKECGLKVEIISQEEEANLFFKGVMQDFDDEQDFTIVDVGGGSVQVLIGNKKELKNMYLFKTGAQYLMDVYTSKQGGEDHPEWEEMEKMKDFVKSKLSVLPKGLRTPVIYGSSCILDVFKELNLEMEEYCGSKSHTAKCKIEMLKSFYEEIVPIPYRERDKRYLPNREYYMWGLDKALVNILTICEIVDSPFVIPSNANINLGLIASLK